MIDVIKPLIKAAAGLEGEDSGFEKNVCGPDGKVFSIAVVGE